MKKGFWYRFGVILACYIFLGAIVLGSLANVGVLDHWKIWVGLGAFVLAFALTILINELVIRKNQKK